MQKKYVDSVIFAKDAGFDAVTFHAAHGNIMPQFFSELYNKRTDWYGGNFENRVRFAREIVEKAREAVGPNFPLIMRISGDEYIEGGRKIEETVEICKVMEKAGIDAFDVSGGIQATYLFSIAPYNFPGLKGFMMPSAKAIKEAVNVPVIGAGGVRDPEYAEWLLENGYADVISIGRAFIADPDFGVKTLENRYCNIRPCLTCNNCLNEIYHDRILTCTVNPEVGREDDFRGIDKADVVKKVLVVGGGASGMEAARVLALRGHRVTLVEKNSCLGGSMAVAGIPPHKEKITELVTWYTRILEDLGVDIQVNCVFSEDMCKEYDVIFSAVGADYSKVIPGSNSQNVITAITALTHPELVGEKVVIIGGGATGCETAEFFGARAKNFNIRKFKNFEGDMDIEIQENTNFKNKDVTVVEMMPELCIGVEGFSKKILLKKLEINGVKTMTNTCVLEIADAFVQVVERNSGGVINIPADTIILAGGLKSNAISVDNVASNICVTGDADAPGRIINALFKSYCLARDI